MEEHIRQSNLIEGIDSPEEDRRSLRAWNWLIKQPYIGTPELKELQRRITLKSLEKRYQGVYRPIQVYVGNHIPPAPALVPSMMFTWLTHLYQDWKTLSPQLLHIQFESIHPFVDGNGRTGRMLMWWHEIKQGKEPTLIKADERQEYYKWFRSKS